MDRDSGHKDSPIWLLGDSPPETWQDRLAVPLDPRHPARHNIWTPIIDGIQGRVFQPHRIRVDATKVYVRNAIDRAAAKKEVQGRDWTYIASQIEELKELLKGHKPPIVFSFGAFAFEFSRRSLGTGDERAYTNWSSEKLGKEFRTAIRQFRPLQINLIPLLHVSIARGKFIEAHNYFTDQEGGNYFEYVAERIAGVLLRHREELDVWVK